VAEAKERGRSATVERFEQCPLKVKEPDLFMQYIDRFFCNPAVRCCRILSYVARPS
jgi:hypothetical protein